MIDRIHDQIGGLADNDLFAAGLALGAFGIATACLSGVLRRAATLLWRRMTTEVVLDSRSAAFEHLSLWLERSGVLRRARRLRVMQIGGRGRWRFGASGTGDDEQLLMTPGEGLHLFASDGTLVLLHRRIDTKSKAETHDGSTGPLETMTLTVFGDGADRVRGWIAEGARLAALAERIGPGIHLHGRHDWEHAGDVPRRPIATVASDDGTPERLLADMRRFLDSREWYADRGVPWRRGYLLHGPPGTGKSSLIRAVASELDRDIALIDVARPSLSDDALREALVNAPSGAILAMEDVDAVFRGREGEKRSGPSFSGLLNAIDGVAAQEGRALVMTTNHPERLDPALVRPGRADLHLEIGPLGAAGALAMYRRFFPEAQMDEAAFRRRMGDARLPAAVLQGWFLRHCEDAGAALRIDDLLRAGAPAIAAE